ncbi:MAG TPA: copper chaperone PCu(A)C [Afifellaceae bacterium]|nr:copper chaperone PCu(A)C [Afifellaceae bacterium]
MNRNILKIVAAIALSLFAANSFAGDMKPVMHGELEIGQPWVRATPPSAPAGGGYLTITNKGGEPDRLVSAVSDIAARIEIHEMSMDGGVMKMRPLGDGIEIAPGATVTLKPGGFHIMMMKLARQINRGDTVEMTLTFEKAGDVTLQFIAAPIGAKAPPES